MSTFIGRVSELGLGLTCKNFSTSFLEIIISCVVSFVQFCRLVVLKVLMDENAAIVDFCY